MLFYFLLAILLSMLQTQVGGVLLSLPLVVWVSQKVEQRSKVYLLAFATGVMVDVLLGRLVGQTAVFQLVTILVLEVLNFRFRRDWKVAVAVLVLFEVFYWLLVSRFSL